MANHTKFNLLVDRIYTILIDAFELKPYSIDNTKKISPILVARSFKLVTKLFGN